MKEYGKQKNYLSILIFKAVTNLDINFNYIIYIIFLISYVFFPQFDSFYNKGLKISAHASRTMDLVTFIQTVLILLW